MIYLFRIKMNIEKNLKKGMFMNQVSQYDERIHRSCSVPF